MKTYIGTKTVKAEPAWKVTTEDGRTFIHAKSDDSEFAGKIEDGYKVVYKDGYESWSPKAVFEETYRDVGGMSFGLAIEAAKMGMKIARMGWNGKNQYVELATNISYVGTHGYIVNCGHDAIGNKALAFVGTSGVQMGWLASQADMLADDWQIVDQAWKDIPAVPDGEACPPDRLDI